MSAVVTPEAANGRTADDGLVLLANDAMLARRRPGLILLVWLWESAIALIGAWPFAAVAHSAYGRHPLGDGALWSPGALEVLDLVRHVGRGRPALLAAVALMLLVAGLAGLAIAAVLLTSMAHATRERRAPRLRHMAGRVLAAYPSMLVLWVVTLSAQGLVAGVGFALGTALYAALVPSLGEAYAGMIATALVLFFVGGVLTLGVLQDLARAAIVRYRTRAFAAVRCASLAFVVLASLHQIVVIVRVSLRASWLAKALRIVDSRAAPRSG